MSSVSILFTICLDFAPIIAANESVATSESLQSRYKLENGSACIGKECDLQTPDKKKQYKIRRFKEYAGWYLMPFPLPKLHRKGAVQNLGTATEFHYLTLE